LKDYQRRSAYSAEFVEAMSLATSRAFASWQAARQKNDFLLFQADLEHIIGLKQQECALLGYEGHPYNALIEEYEPGARVAMLDKLFAGVKTSLTSLLDRVNNSTAPVHLFEGQHFNKDRQWDIGMALLRQMGYDFDAGRQDLAPHPFCITFSPGDVRVTTRINEKDVFDMLSSCIHEGGHALYEQGLKAENYGLPAGMAVSLGIHESQSRLWENNVGRSYAYWQQNFHLLQKAFPGQCENLGPRDAYVANNLIRPSLIRVQADELTYHFHIMIRYDLEKALITGDLKVSDLPAAWNECYEKYLGIAVPNDVQGVLQDIHWAHGSIGYFPTYTLGSFYAAQFFARASKEIPDLNTLIEMGDLLPLKAWLNECIHQHGKLYTAEELCTAVSGEPLNYSYFHQYMEAKLSDVYGW
jgi:carboxypeptidase Taq